VVVVVVLLLLGLVAMKCSTNEGIAACAAQLTCMETARALLKEAATGRYMLDSSLRKTCLQVRQGQHAAY
jgi:hypothetical protein